MNKKRLNGLRLGAESFLEELSDQFKGWEEDFQEIESLDDSADLWELWDTQYICPAREERVVQKAREIFSTSLPIINGMSADELRILLETIPETLGTQEMIDDLKERIRDIYATEVESFKNDMNILANLYDGSPDIPEIEEIIVKAMVKLIEDFDYQKIERLPYWFEKWLSNFDCIPAPVFCKFAEKLQEILDHLQQA
jgi:hypothetical protein